MKDMAEKDSGKYHYEPYTQISKSSSATANMNMPGPSMKRMSSEPVEQDVNTSPCCACGSNSSQNGPFWVGLLTNLGICALLFAYTLLGSFIFLAIEGGASQMHQRTLASTNRQIKLQTRTNDNSNNFTAISRNLLQETHETRQRTVENIWDITVSLNILYRENWTRLAAIELAKFQDQIMKQILNEIPPNTLSTPQIPATGAITIPQSIQDYEWTFARAFLYSLTVLTTIGYGNIAPRTTLGRIVTLGYAVLGIPLTLVYLSSTGGVLARVARGVFSRALCCCLCSNCGYCCYDEKRMAEKERRMKRKRQQMEMKAQQIALQEPYYVRSGALHNSLHSPDKQQSQIPDIDSLSSTDIESGTSMHGLSILAPVCLCICMMVVYIIIGAISLYKLEGWPILDGIYFCFMSLSTIGFGDLVPGLRKESTSTTWFCSIYIMSGMALTAMCFNVLHEEIIHRLKHVVDAKNNKKGIIMKNSAGDDSGDCIMS